jgi:hypothetical protein
MSLIRITNGTVYDPVNGVDGVVQDIWIQDDGGLTFCPDVMRAWCATTRSGSRRIPRSSSRIIRSLKATCPAVEK